MLTNRLWDNRDSLHQQLASCVQYNLVTYYRCLQEMVQFLEGFAASGAHEELLENLKEWTDTESKPQDAQEPPAKPFRRQIVWFNLLGFLALHLAAVYGFYLGITQCSPLTIIWSK